MKDKFASYRHVSGNVSRALFFFFSFYVCMDICKKGAQKYAYAEFDLAEYFYAYTFFRLSPHQLSERKLQTRSYMRSHLFK